MIVYAGKQYGNEFNNGDEALFEDANRPRDNNMFKITPGMQAGRWDWKKTNKNREPALFNAYGYAKVTGYPPVTYKAQNGVIPTRIKFKAKYTQSDLSSVAPYYAANTITYSASDLLGFVKDAYSENGDAKATVRDDGLEIMEDGVYFIDAFAQFIYPSGYDYLASTSYPLFMSLLVYDNETKLWNMYAPCQGRSCFYLDRLHETFASTIPKGTRLSLGVGHGYTTSQILVACGITAVRVG